MAVMICEIIHSHAWRCKAAVGQSVNPQQCGRGHGGATAAAGGGDALAQARDLLLLIGKH